MSDAFAQASPASEQAAPAVEAGAATPAASGAAAEAAPTTAAAPASGSAPTEAAPAGAAAPASSGAVAAAAPADAAAAAAPATGLAGFEALATVGYGATTEVNTLEINPYGAALGVDLGYTWNTGVRVGAKLTYGMGRAIHQMYEFRRREIELTADSSSLNVLATISYDLPLHWLILRYSLGLGVTWVHWDLGELEGTIEGYTAPSGSSVGFLFAPGLTVLWPYKSFEWGLGFDYLFQAEYHNPSGIVGQLLVGVKL